MQVKSSILLKISAKKRVWYPGILLLAVALFLLLVGSATLDGVSFSQMDWEFWRGGTQSPTIIIYIIVVSPIINNYWNRAVNILLPLLKNIKTKEKLLENINKSDHWREWGAALLAITIVIVISQTWTWPHQWLDWYKMLTNMTMIGLLGWLVYTGLRGVYNMTRLTRSIQDLDIFNLEVLSPVAKWSLGVSLAFIGGITISLVFVPASALLNAMSISVYSVLIITTILIFFISLLSTHNAILRVKRQELKVAKEQLALAFRKLRGTQSRQTDETDEQVFTEVTAWGTYETAIRGISEWPYNAGIIRNLLVSVISPTVVYLIKAVLGIQFG